MRPKSADERHLPFHAAAGRVLQQNGLWIHDSHRGGREALHTVTLYTLNTRAQNPAVQNRSLFKL